MKQLVKALSGLIKTRGRRDKGMATAEYAIGTVAVMSLGGVIIKILSDPQVRELIWKFIQWIVEWIMGLITG